MNEPLVDKKSTNQWLHAGNIGDCFASIPSMNEYYKKTGQKIVLYLVNGQRGFYYEGATHPTKNEKGENVMLNEEMIKMMTPLLLEQESIAEVRIWDDEKIDVDLTMIRETHVGMPSFSINRWYFYVFPDLACDLSQIWMNVPDTETDYAKNKIIITRSERYRNEYIDYSFIKPYEDECIFSGTMREYNNFCMQYDLQIKKLHLTNFLELAQAIKQSRFHLTNQTMAFQISEGLKKPRILELCSFAPNCIPIGEDAYDFFSQGAVEYYFKELAKKYPSK